MAKLRIKKGDTVIVIAGNSKGKKAKVLEILTPKDKAIVEGINLVSKHQKPSAQNPNGGISKVEAPIHISNLMLVEPSSGKATRTGRKADEDGKIQRYSKKTGQLIKNG